MKKHLSILIILFSSILFSCTQKTPELNKVVINSEKSKEWNLPELNFISEVPKEYVLSFNEGGGFYFQARKFGNSKNLLARISIGSIEGGSYLNDKNIIKLLNGFDEALSNRSKTMEKVNYETVFIGEGIINKTKLKHLRGLYEFENYDISMDGKFYTFIAPIVLNEQNNFMLSAMFKKEQNLNAENIGIDLLNFIDSIELLE